MTQQEMILRYIRHKGSITTLESVNKLLILDPQKNIQKLKEKGFKIKDKWISKTNAYGKRVRFKKYWLEE